MRFTIAYPTIVLVTVLAVNVKRFGVWEGIWLLSSIHFFDSRLNVTRIGTESHWMGSN